MSSPRSPRSSSFSSPIKSPQHSPSAPAHNVFSFDGIVFSSSFDNGNLGRVERVPNRPYEFKVWTAPDNMGTEFQSKYCAWFHFSVTGLPMGCVLRIQLVNASNHSGLYKHDMRPVFRSNSTNQKWVRIRSSVRFIRDGDDAQLYFEHSVDSENDKIFFAFTYPYSYSQLQSELANYDIHMNRMDVPGSLFYQRELLTHSCDGRRLDLLTISSVDGASPIEREPLLPGLFPDTPSPNQSHRPPVFANKEVILVSARVHPGEVPAQHTFKGVLSLLMDPEDQTAIELRAKYVFKLIPMLNPDGVFRGHFRMDQHGHNLNRYYNNPDASLQPTIFAAKSLLDYYAQIGGISMYLDMHAHASKRGCFIYGNVLDQLEDQIQNQLYCKLISMNSPHFDYEGCLFSREHMFRIDPGDQAKGLTAEGSGRVHSYLAYGLVHSYTLECNYNTSRIGNEVAPPEQEILGSNVTPASNFTTNPEKYTPASWAGVGRACIVAMLDIRGQNPCSRIPKSKLKTLDRVRNAVVLEVRSRKEYQGKQMNRERRRSVAEKKLAGVSATQSDEFVWRRVVDGYDVSGSGSRSGSTTARSSAASLSIAAAAAAAMEQQTRLALAENNSANSQSNGSYIYIPAGKDRRRRTFSNSTTDSGGKPPKIGVAEQQQAADANATPSVAPSSTVRTASSSAKLRKPPIGHTVASGGSSQKEETQSHSQQTVEKSTGKEKYLHLERLILESQSARVSSHKSLSPLQKNEILGQDAENHNNFSPSKKLSPDIVADTTKQVQEYFQSLIPTTSPNSKVSAASNGEQTNSKSRPRSADPMKRVTTKRDGNLKNVDVPIDIAVPPSNSLKLRENERPSESGKHLFVEDPSTLLNDAPGIGLESRNSKSSDSSRLGVGASIRDLIRDQSIQKLIKLSNNQQMQSTSQNGHSSNAASTSSRRGANSNAGSPSSGGNKDNRKILGKTLHAAGVALLMNNSGLSVSNEPPGEISNSLLSVQGTSASSSRNSSHVSLHTLGNPLSSGANISGR